MMRANQSERDSLTREQLNGQLDIMIQRANTAHQRVRELRSRVGLLRAVILLMVGGLVVGVCLQAAQGQATCHPAEAESTYLWYVPTHTNTSVQLIAHCADGVSSAWTVSFFEGDEPGLLDWSEMQDRASELLGGG